MIIIIIIIITFSITMELRAGEAAVDKLKARFEVQARADGEVGQIIIFI